ncbi:MAG: hypothetical protein JXQ25_06840, partial [Deltaproteobacteria bacterium]|nr:hypothetical protein [Deltaproteobacteria bacterium]
RIIECKAVKTLSISKLSRFLVIDKDGKVTGFNMNYISNHLDESYIINQEIKKEFVLYINSPESPYIADKLKHQLPESLPFTYRNQVTEEEITGTIQITVIAVDK